MEFVYFTPDCYKNSTNTTEVRDLIKKIIRFAMKVLRVKTQYTSSQHVVT